GDYLFGSLRYRLDKTNLDPKRDANGVEITDESIFPLSTANGLTSSITGSLEYDRRNDRFSPSKGIYASTSVEYAGVGGDLNYTKSVTTFKYFKQLFWDLVWRNNISYSFIASHDSKEPPFNELFLLGGPYSLRGYDMFKVGRQKFSNNTFNMLKA